MQPLRTLAKATFQNPSHDQGVAFALPRPITSFVGRADDIDALVAMVLDHKQQLVTVTGPGGIGKTRIALEGARRAAADFQDGVRFVGLADIRTPALLATVVANALGLHEAIGLSLIDRIRDTFRDAHMLLVIDNLEHLVEATPFLLDILEVCPGISILGTSRRRLSLSGERVFDLDPLRVPFKTG